MKCPYCQNLLMEQDKKTGKFGTYYSCPVCNKNIGSNSMVGKQMQEMWGQRW